MASASKLRLYTCVETLISVVACSRHTEAPTDVLPMDRLAAYENLTVLQVDSSLAMAAYSERPEGSEPVSGILAYRAEKGRWREVFRRTLTSAYNARIELRREMLYSGQPTVVFRVQYGAAAETQEVYG